MRIQCCGGFPGIPGATTQCSDCPLTVPLQRQPATPYYTGLTEADVRRIVREELGIYGKEALKELSKP